jgi:hypothetical protein
MITKRLLPIAATLLAAAGFAGHATPALAGDLTNLHLACYVDTYAYDQLSNDSCYSVWTPSTASNPTVAYFKVTGLPTGNYTYTWKNVATGATGICAGTANYCTRTIRIIGAADGVVTLQVTVRDNATGATKSATATATYIDGYH